jgi:hypothetical protein
LHFNTRMRLVKMTFGTTPVDVRTDDPERKVWSASIPGAVVSREAETTDDDRVTLVVRGDSWVEGLALDSRPDTVARADPTLPGWQQYEAGEDSLHKVRIDVTPTYLSKVLFEAGGKTYYKVDWQRLKQPPPDRLLRIMSDEALSAGGETPEGRTELTFSRPVSALDFRFGDRAVTHNTVWDGPYKRQDKATWQDEMAVGAFINAPAALKSAVSRSGKKIVTFTKEEIEQAKNIKPEKLLQVHDMLRVADLYSASSDLGVPFALKLNLALERLDVIREKNPGGDYAEWLEYTAPGKYRHFAFFNDKDYRQGPVWVGRKGKVSDILNPLRGEVFYYQSLE